MKLPRLLFIIAALASSALAQTAGVTKSLASASLNEITGDLIFPSARSLTLNGTLAGTPTGGTLNLSGLTLTLPTSFTWAGVLSGANGGTGVANSGKTITLGGNLVTSGAFGLTLTLTGATTVTLPTSGTLATLAGTETLTNKTLTSPVLTTPNIGAATGTSVNLSGAGTFGGNLTVSGTGTHTFGTTNTVTIAAGKISTTGKVGIGTTAHPNLQLTVVQPTANAAALWTESVNTLGQSQGVIINAGTNASDFGLVVRNAAQTEMFKVDGASNATLSGNLTVSGTGGITSSSTSPLLKASTTALGAVPKLTLENTNIGAWNVYLSATDGGDFKIDQDLTNKFRMALGTGNVALAGALTTGGNIVVGSSAITLQTNGSVLAGYTRSTVADTSVYSAASPSSGNIQGDLYRTGGAATGRNILFRFSDQNAVIGYFGTVQNAGGRADFIWNQYGTDNVYADRMRLSSDGNLTVNGAGNHSFSGQLNVGLFAASSLATFNGGATIAGGTLAVSSTTASTSTTTGALRVSGGVGVAGNVNAGGNVTAADVLLGGTSGPSTLSSLSSRAPRGGIAFDGTSGARISSTLTNQNLGTDSFSVSMTIEVPTANPSTSRGLWYLSSSNTTNNVANAAFAELKTAGELVVYITGAASSDVRTVTVSGFRASYSGKHVVLTFVRDSSASTMTVYANGVALSGTGGTTGTPPAWSGSVTSTYFVLGNNASGGEVWDRAIYSASLYNLALSASDVVEIYENSGAVPFRYQFGTQVAVLSDNFSSTASPWTDYGSGRISYDSTNQELDCTFTAAGQEFYRTSWGPEISKAYRMRLTLKNVSAGSGAGWRIYNNTSNETIYSGSFVNGTVDFTFTKTGAGTNALAIRRDVGTGTDTFTIDDFIVNRVGAIVYLTLDDGVGYQLHDASTNKLDAVMTTTGVSHLIAKREGYVRGTLTWASAFDTKSLLGQQAFPSGVVLTDIIRKATASTSGTGCAIGTSNAANRWQGSTAMTTAKTVATINNRLPAGSSANDLDVLVTPDSVSYTGSITLEIKYAVTEGTP